MEDNNIIHHANGVAILNGGNGLPGCPTSWEEARKIEDNLNNGITKEDDEYKSSPRWSFDCGFKLDFDGPLLRISSRFYPPKTHYGPTWDGDCTVYFLGKEIIEKHFDCNTLDELKNQVEQWLKEITDKIADTLKTI